MVKISNVSYENEIQRLDNPFNEDSRNVIFVGQGGPNLGEGLPENLAKMAKNKETYSYANSGVVNSDREYWIKVVAITLVFLHVRSNYLLKIEKVSFQAKFCPNFATLLYLKLETFFEF